MKVEFTFEIRVRSHSSASRTYEITEIERLQRLLDKNTKKNFEGRVYLRNKCPEPALRRIGPLTFEMESPEHTFGVLSP